MVVFPMIICLHCPAVPVGSALFRPADTELPAVHTVNRIAFNDTAAREAQETRLKLLQRFHKIPAEYSEQSVCRLE